MIDSFNDKLRVRALRIFEEDGAYWYYTLYTNKNTQDLVSIYTHI